jgi:phage regulator Rha-like protein
MNDSINDLSGLVILTDDGEPRASSITIAAGMQAKHASVLRLVRNHIASLEEFGLVGFEIRAREPGRHGGGDVEFAMLNEQQAALLITFMRNTARVESFKVALVREFYRMRDALHHRELTLWERRLRLELRDRTSHAKAQVGSRLMHDRKKDLPGIKTERAILDVLQQPSLLN